MKSGRWGLVGRASDPCVRSATAGDAGPRLSTTSPRGRAPRGACSCSPPCGGSSLGSPSRRAAECAWNGRSGSRTHQHGLANNCSHAVVYAMHRTSGPDDYPRSPARTKLRSSVSWSQDLGAAADPAGDVMTAIAEHYWPSPLRVDRSAVRTDPRRPAPGRRDGPEMMDTIERGRPFTRSHVARRVAQPPAIGSTHSEATGAPAAFEQGGAGANLRPCLGPEVAVDRLTGR
jgi:hypothetical protein